MFSFGWSEIALTLIIVVIVVGPKEIPNLLKHIGHFSQSIKKISREFKKSLNDIAEESDIKDIKNSISEIKNIKEDIDPSSEIKKEFNSIKEDIDPSSEIKKEFDSIKDTKKFFENEIKDIQSLNEEKDESK